MVPLVPTKSSTGTISYTYNNGNLLNKTDARNVTTTFVYDVLNRPTSKSYNDSPQTPPVSYFYDGQSLPSGAPSFDRGSSTGRLVAVTYGGASAGNYYGFDALGRVVTKYQQTDLINYLIEATYYADSAVHTEVYPSVPGASDRRTVSSNYDSAARLSSLSSPATTYAPAASTSGISYKPHGGLEAETLGNALLHQLVYNSRLQTNAVKLGTTGNPTSVLNLTYDYGTTDNNGNLKSHVNTIGSLAITDTFAYDSLNRPLSAAETSTAGGGWTENNDYDRYGNRRINLGGGSYSLSFNAATNRVNTSGYAYDSAGNLTNDTIHTYTFDGENKILKVDNVSAYVCDGEGQRVRKLVGENTRFVYGIGGELIAEFSGASGNLTKEYVAGGGMMAVIDPSAGTRYTTADHLGSPRVVTDSSGNVVSRHDYMPFGIELGAGVSGRTTTLGYGVSDGVRDQFTGQRRDTESGLDYFGARYYSAAHGRFTSADPLMASARATSPQSWNRYSYVLNKPMNLIDPNGLAAVSNCGCSAEFHQCSGGGIENDPTYGGDMNLDPQGNVRAYNEFIAQANAPEEEPQNSVASQEHEGAPTGPFVVTDPIRYANEPLIGDGDCVALVRAAAPDLPKTSLWRPGDNVFGNRSIQEGTVIATFVGDQYPNKPHGNHAAIYLGQDKGGIWVVDQFLYGRGGVKMTSSQRRYIQVKEWGTDPSNNARAFSVVMAAVLNPRPRK